MKKLLSVLLVLLLVSITPFTTASAEKIKTIKWGKISYKSDQIGKIVVSNNTSVYKYDSKQDKLTYLKSLKKETEHAIYSQKESKKHGTLISIGNAQYVKKSAKSIQYKEPSKHMKEIINKEKVWVYNQGLYVTDIAKKKDVLMKNLQEVVIISKKQDATAKNTYNIKIKANSKYYMINLAEADLLDEYYFKKNPFKTFKYSTATWNLIKAEKIKIGMTMEQVYISWGTPDDVNTYTDKYGTMEQWIYEETSPTYLYFENDKLSAIQE